MSAAAPDGALRVVVEPSDTVLHNHGDAAMLQVALDRLRAELPTARIEVFTEEPERLLARCPTVVPLPVETRRAATGGELDALRRLLPAAAGRLRALRPPARWASEAFPDTSRALARWGVRFVGGGDPGVAYRRQLAGAALLLVAGMGGLTDAFRNFAAALLDSIGHALDAGVPVALMGQGIGPLADRGLHARAARLLPRAALIALREGRTSPRLLAEIGVPAERIVVTGDDAISFAFAQRPVALGDGIGVNARIADYAGTARRDVGPIAAALRTAAAAAVAPLVPVPIACHGGYDDAETVRAMLGAATAERVGSPELVLDRVARCRVVVTGSYHAGVFALAMGVPVVALVASAYYHDKMWGLAHQFGADGCRVVALDGHDAPAALADAVATQWADAERLRPTLLAAAERQAAVGREAYRRLAGIVRRGPEAEA